LLRTWKANGTIGISGNDSEALSWTADERTLAFSWYGGPGAGERLLDLGKSGTSLLGNSRDALPQSTATCEGGEDQIITPDGSSIVCGASLSNGSGFEEYSTATGKPTRTLWRWVSSGQTEVLWSNPDGSVLVGEVPGGVVGMITDGRFVAIAAMLGTYEDPGAW